MNTEKIIWTNIKGEMKGEERNLVYEYMANIEIKCSDCLKDNISWSNFA